MKKISICLFLCLLAVYFLLSQLKFQDYLKIDFLDVGQGDSILLSLPYFNQNILIDGGPNNSIQEQLNSSLPSLKKTIDLVVLTHPHSDHLAGLFNVLENYEVKAVMGSGIFGRDSQYQRFFQVLNEKNIPFILAKKSQDIKLNNLTLDIIYPENYLAFTETDDQNNNSVIIKIGYCGRSVLFLGDAEKEELKTVLSAGDSIKADIIKVGHHGSKTSLLPEFFELVNPEVAIIQVGRGNSFGHPHKETLDFFQKINVKILTTMEEGRISLKIYPDKSFSFS